MRAVIQRVSRASVTVDGLVVGAIGSGMTVLLGAGKDDTDQDVNYIVDKIANLRIFSDPNDKMNLSILDAAGGILLISQFTLYGDARRGRRPTFTAAMEPVVAKQLYLQCFAQFQSAGVAKVAAGIFGADMHIEMLANGPVTIMLDSKKLF
jgi:D-aminoacyl-tRNA deacylase